jgi:hypothetical protein
MQMVDAVGCGTLLSGLIGLFVIDIFQISSVFNYIHSGALQPLAPPLHPPFCLHYLKFSQNFFYGDQILFELES